MIQEVPNTEYLDHIPDRTSELLRLMRERAPYEVGSEQWNKINEQIILLINHKVYR